ncbi:MAG: UbiA prenyltransferase family protein [Trueperaceae bacterium]|nr:UbiA prenyltransferase family protein [Trueperaceae bacterium]
MKSFLSLFKHPYYKHLRLNFNILLSPIYLWGVLLAGGSIYTLNFWLGYLALHVFLYGGTTAFNSYFDKDEGPIGGMLEPPKVDRGLLIFSLIFQALGLPLAYAVSQTFFIAWCLLFLIAAAYSYPLTRLKASPVGALLSVGLGQGALGFATGWLIPKQEFSSLYSSKPFIGMVSTSLIVAGLYIITQTYQTAEDRQRGDRTLPVLLGPKTALFIALILLGIGGGILLGYSYQSFGLGWAVALAVFFAAIAISLLQWALRFKESAVKANFYRAMRTVQLSSLGLSLFLLYHLI